LGYLLSLSNTEFTQTLHIHSEILVNDQLDEQLFYFMFRSLYTIIREIIIIIIIIIIIMLLLLYAKVTN